MSINSVLDTCIQVQSFRNLDLFEQGIYMIQVSFEDSQATPYVVDECISPRKPRSEYQITEGLISDFSYFTRSFLIRYAEEEATLGDVVIFRSEQESSPKPLIINIGLLIADSKQFLSEAEAVKNPPSLSDFTLVQSRTIVIENPLQGVNQFLPIIFAQKYPCQVALCVHMVQVDYRYRFNQIGYSYNLNRFCAHLMFPKQTSVTADSFYQAYKDWVQHLRLIFRKNWTKLQKFLETVQALEMLPAPLPEEVEKPAVQDPEEAAALIVAECQEVAVFLHEIFRCSVEVVKAFPAEFALYLQKDYLEMLKDHWGGCTFRDFHKVKTLAESSSSSSGNFHASVASSIRQTPLFANTDHFEAYQGEFFAKYARHPVLFQDIFYLGETEVPHEWSTDWFTFMPSVDFKVKGIHLIMFVHGFLGSSFDVRVMKNAVASLRPDCLLVCSCMNEGETEGDIEEMGQRLAEEVKQQVKGVPKRMLKKISFIGHSLGGVIIRSALPLLQDYASLFHMFLTFSSPHLGYMHNSSALVGAGMWILKKWRKSKCMLQLTMTDQPNVRDCFLYKLSTQKGIGFFKHVALVSCYQDSYAPYESSRVEISSKITSDRQKGPVLIEMANQLMQQVSAQKLYRLDINYKGKNKSIDNWIGRSAHIEMLDNTGILQMVLFSCAHFFE